MSDLRHDLDDLAEAFRPDPMARQRIQRRAERRRLSRRIATGVAAFAIAIGSFSVLWVVSRPVSEPVGTPTITGTAIPTSTTPSPALTPEGGLSLGIMVPDVGWHVLADASGVYVGGARTLTRVDPNTGTAAVLASADWDYDYAVLATGGDDTVLVASGRELWTVDSRAGGGIVGSVDLSALGYIDGVLQVSPQAGGGTWVSAYRRRSIVAEIDPSTGQALVRIDTGQGAHDIVQAGPYLFLSQVDHPELLRIDTRTNDVMPVTLPRFPAGLAVVGDALWWTSGAGAVNCLDVEHLTTCGVTQIPRAGALASDGDRLWVLSATGSKEAGTYAPDPRQPATVTLLDGNTGEMLAGPLALPGRTPVTISAFDGHAWIGFYQSGRVVRIDRCDPTACQR
jgi:hypothetical protein